MALRIVADSSANLLSDKDQSFISVPLTINAGADAYVDNEQLNVEQMLAKLDAFSGKTGTACPAPGDWIEAFGDSDEVVAITITSNLSGAYSSAAVASELYMAENPGKRVCVLDSLSTGPEMELLKEKAQELAALLIPFEELCERMKAYMKKTHLAFSLESLSNLVRNGRVSPVLAKVVEFLDIRVVGRASAVGDLEPQNKVKGAKRAMAQILKNMQAMGYTGGKVRIRHTMNPGAADLLRKLILEVFPGADVIVAPNRGLCAFYAERGGVLVGFEG